MADTSFRTFDASRWQQRIASIHTSEDGDPLRLNYIDCRPADGTITHGTILLIHGFPQTSYQFRHVITPLSDAGYRVVAPDYRGAGKSSKPVAGYEKSRMAEDLHQLVQSHLGIKDKMHVVGHDIGGMIAFAYASRYPNDVASVIWGECPLPGSTFYEQIKGTPGVFHFVFHQVPDLPEALIAGREKIYLQHFFDKLLYNSAAISPADLEQYTVAYAQPGAIRAGINVYRAFEKDAEENRKWLRENGKLTVPAMGMVGKESFLAASTESMLKEVHEGSKVDTFLVEESSHYIAEENPESFIKGVLGFVGKHS
ncbi:alpha/beta-hydrolase [Periconia macrospinosa]|uniref:Alpha/beta-hydrolase n=1 Tax=Periconia macrospinosa TaxID=97972 RepID=A0A2V1DDL2_9PLEO|nr:alpha/beta-hydrolase [Periconia macrospinosa]